MRIYLSVAWFYRGLWRIALQLSHLCTICLGIMFYLFDIFNNLQLLHLILQFTPLPSHEWRSQTDASGASIQFKKKERKKIIREKIEKVLAVVLGFPFCCINSFINSTSQPQLNQCSNIHSMMQYSNLRERILSGCSGWTVLYNWVIVGKLKAEKVCRHFWQEFQHVFVGTTVLP